MFAEYYFRCLLLVEKKFLQDSLSARSVLGKDDVLQI